VTEDANTGGMVDETVEAFQAPQIFQTFVHHYSSERMIEKRAGKQVRVLQQATNSNQQRFGQRGPDQQQSDNEPRTGLPVIFL